MIGREQCMLMALVEVPRFAAAWNRHLAYWGDDPRGLCIDLTAFAEFVIDDLKSNAADATPAFALIERLLGEGDEEVKNAAATCFLEPVVHRVPGELRASDVLRHLGPRSRAYVAAWDAFTGVKTE